MPSLVVRSPCRRTLGFFVKLLGTTRLNVEKLPTMFFYTVRTVNDVLEDRYPFGR